MAPPRFAATGRRLSLLDTTVGLSSGRRPNVLPDAGVTPGFLQQTREDDEKWQQARDFLLEHGDYTPSQVDAMINISKARGAQAPRPTSFLEAVTKVLSVGESAVVGFFSGMTDYIDEKDREGSVPPWAYVASVGKGFAEIDDAVSNGATFESRLKTVNEPGDFLYDNAKAIGITSSIVLDPINWVSFGATTVSKSAAKATLAMSYRQSISEATAIINRGGINALTGKAYTWGDWEEVVARVHMDAGRPFTPGDAMNDLRRASQERNAALRRFQFDPSEGGTMRRVGATAKAFLLPTAHKGGQGLRFGGVEVPGTARMFEAIGGRAREAVGPSMSREGLVSEFSANLIPRSKMRSIGDDLIRSSAMWDSQHYLDNVRRVRRKAEEVAVKTASVGGQWVPTDVRRRSWAISETIDRSSREGIYVNNVEEHRKLVRGKASEAGIEDDVMDRWWDQALTRAQGDPTMAYYEFAWKLAARENHTDMLEHFLANPMYAIKAPPDVMKMKPGTKIEAGEAVRTAKPGTIMPVGYVPIKHKGETFWVRKEIADTLEELKNPAMLEQQMGWFLRMINKPQQLWKVAATVMNPSFHAMNFVGAVWNNMLAAVFNPVDYLRSLATVYNARLEQAAEAGQKSGLTLGLAGGIAGAAAGVAGASEAGLGLGETIMAGAAGAAVGGTAGTIASPVPKSTARGRAAKLEMEELEARGALGMSAFMQQETVRGSPLRKAFEEAVGRERSLTDKLTTPSPATAESNLGPITIGPRTKLAAKRTRQAGAIAAGVATGGPGALPFMLPEIAAVGREIAGWVEDVVRVAPIKRYANDPVIAQVLNAYGPISSGSTGFKGMTKAEKATMYDIASDISKMFQFDYTDLTVFERRIAKTIMPFYTFHKKNLVRQTSEAIRQPRNINVASQVMQYMDEEGYDLGGLEMILPDYFSQIGAFQVPMPDWAREKLGVPQDQPLFLNPKIPYMAAFAFYPPLWNVLLDNGTPTPQRWAALLAPYMGATGIYKLPMELIFNRQLGLNRTIDYQRAQSNDLRQSVMDAPGYAKYLPGPLKDWLGIFADPDTGTLKMHNTTRYMMDQLVSPFISNFGNTIPTSSDFKARADTISWLTGVRIIPFDALQVSRGWSYHLESILEAERTERRQRGELMDFEDEVLLKQSRASIKVLNDAYDRQLKEMALDE